MALGPQWLSALGYVFHIFFVVSSSMYVLCLNMSIFSCCMFVYMLLSHMRVDCTLYEMKCCYVLFWSKNCFSQKICLPFALKFAHSDKTFSA